LKSAAGLANFVSPSDQVATTPRSINSLAKIVLLIIERDREARSFMDTDLQVQALMMALDAEIASRLAHADRGDGAIRRLESPPSRHRQWSSRCLFGGYNLLKQPEMLADESEGDEVADPSIKLGRASEVAE
jgi:hypothetical protein